MDSTCPRRAAALAILLASCSGTYQPTDTDRSPDRDDDAVRGDEGRAIQRR